MRAVLKERYESMRGGIIPSQISTQPSPSDLRSDLVSKVTVADNSAPSHEMSSDEEELALLLENKSLKEEVIVFFIQLLAF